VLLPVLKKPGQGPRRIQTETKRNDLEEADMGNGLASGKIRLRIGNVFSHGEEFDVSSRETMVWELRFALHRYRLWLRHHRDEATLSEPVPALRIRTPQGGWVWVMNQDRRVIIVRPEMLRDGGQWLWEKICETARELNRYVLELGNLSQEAVGAREGDKRRPQLRVLQGGKKF
jgi:hypothetical protein